MTDMSYRPGIEEVLDPLVVPVLYAVCAAGLVTIARG